MSKKKIELTPNLDVDGILKVSFLHRKSDFSPAYTDERCVFSSFQ